MGIPHLEKKNLKSLVYAIASSHLIGHYKYSISPVDLSLAECFTLLQFQRIKIVRTRSRTSSEYVHNLDLLRVIGFHGSDH